jgi:hypothetical protein
VAIVTSADDLDATQRAIAASIANGASQADAVASVEVARLAASGAAPSYRGRFSKQIVKLGGLKNVPDLQQRLGTAHWKSPLLTELHRLLYGYEPADPR